MIVRALGLALAWIALTGELSVPALAEALGLGLLCALVTAPRRKSSLGWLRRLPQALSLALFFLWELVLSNVRVAGIVVRGERALAPAFVAVPLALEHEGAIALLANLVTLTPGTLSVDVSPDRRTLFVHVLDGANPEAVRRDIEDGFLRRVEALFA